LQLVLLGSLAIGAAAAPSDDLSALVQREVLAHRSASEQAEGSVEQAMEAALSGFSQGRLVLGHEAPTKGGIRMKRKIKAFEKDAKIQVHLNSGCHSSDSYGDDDCMLHWDDDVEFNANIHVPSGLQAGDGVRITASVTASSTGTAKAMLDGVFSSHGAMKTTMNCGLCSGSCEMTGTNEARDWQLQMVTPTVMDNAFLCDSLGKSAPVTDFTLADVKFKLPAAMAELQMKGSAVFDVSMSRPGKGDIIFVSSTIDILPSDVPPARLMELPSAATQLAAAAPAVTELAAPELAAPPQRSVGQGLADLYASSWRNAFTAITSNLPAVASHPAATQLWQTRSADAGHSNELNSIIFKLVDVTVRDQVKYSSNISLWDATNCISLNQADDLQCTVMFGQKATFNLNMNTELDLQPGSNVRITFTPKFKGPFGMMMKQFIPEQHFKIPACGNEAVKIVEMGNVMEIKPGKCGVYKTRFSYPQMTVDVPDLASVPIDDLMPKDMKLPFKFGSLSKLPPITIVADMLLSDHEDKPIIHAQMEMGVDHASK